MAAVVASRNIRRRAVAYGLLLAITLGLMAFSGAPPIRELQHGIGYAFLPFERALNGVAGGIASVVGTVGEIEGLRGENERLRAENETLRNQQDRLDAIKAENDQLTALLQLRNGLEFDTVAATVIARDSSEFRRVITIDRGSDDRIAVGDSVVVAGAALAGRVIDVGPSFAHVLLINDTSSTVVGQLGSSRATGEVVGQLGGVLVMRNIDATAKVPVGDEVLTAGIELNGGVRSPYPKGLLLGQIVDVRTDANAVVQTAYLDAAADLEGLEYVLVITSYEGGLPPPDQQPTVCPSPGQTLPGGEQPCYTPAPSASPASTPRATTKPSAKP